jgi:hypothetical protein
MVLQAGNPGGSNWPVNPENILRVLERTRGAYTVLIDGPSDPLDPLGPALAAAADSTVLVVTADATRGRDIADFQRSTDFPVGKTRGVVLVSGTGATL